MYACEIEKLNFSKWRTKKNAAKRNESTVMSTDKPLAVFRFSRCISWWIWKQNEYYYMVNRNVVNHFRPLFFASIFESNGTIERIYEIIERISNTRDNFGILFQAHFRCCFSPSIDKCSDYTDSQFCIKNGSLQSRWKDRSDTMSAHYFSRQKWSIFDSLVDRVARNDRVARCQILSASNRIIISSFGTGMHCSRANLDLLCLQRNLKCDRAAHESMANVLSTGDVFMTIFAAWWTGRGRWMRRRVLVMITFVATLSHSSPH